MIDVRAGARYNPFYLLEDRKARPHAEMVSPLPMLVESICPMLNRFLKNYIARHQHPVNQILHIVGVPLTFVGSAVCLGFQLWWWAAGCFVFGYILQFVGHAVEGNDAGELILAKKALGKPYIEFAPGSNRSDGSD